MKSIQPFIDLGWHTVPLKGQLKRLEDGDKTTPQFEKGWKDKYQKEFNENATSIGGTMTGAVSNIIAIDCDSQVTYDMFRALDPEYEFHFISKGKPKGGGTIVYKYPHVVNGTEALTSFSIRDEFLDLDFFSDQGFIYLPTGANETKERWSHKAFNDFPALSDTPKPVLALLHSLFKQYLLSKSPSNPDTKADTSSRKVSYLAPQLELMLAKGEFMPSVFRIITPKDFRVLEQYVKHGYLHPDNVPEGRGSEYLSKLSAIFGADSSISHDLYIKVMNFINNLWDSPIKQARLTSTIITPMVEGKSKIDGDSIWQYDEHWKTRGLTFTTKFGESVEVFFDDVRALYYLVNHTSGSIRYYQKDTDVYSYMDTVGIGIPARKDFKGVLPLVRTTMEPSMPFGFFHSDQYTRSFNMFQQTPALSIINDPTPYKKLYKRPENILNFFNSLVPDPIMRNYLLKFLRYKLATFRYSPVVLYFLGTHGSGKDTLVRILEQIIGANYIGRPSAKEFLEQFNGWIIDTYFTQLDEYGNQLTHYSDKQEALGRIKMYSGKDNIQVRQMRTDGFPYTHSTTFIMTANTNPLILEDEDRRMALFETPNQMKTEPWVTEAGGISKVQEAIDNEIEDFCYYLATEVDTLHPDEYVAPPATEQKHKVIAAKLPAAQRIGYYLKHFMFDDLYSLCDDQELTRVFDHSTEGRIDEDDLYELYIYMTDGKGVKRGLSAAMKDIGIDKIPTTKDGVKAYYYKVPELKYYSVPGGGFKREDDEDDDDGVSISL